MEKIVPYLIRVDSAEDLRLLSLLISTVFRGEWVTYVEMGHRTSITTNPLATHPRLGSTTTCCSYSEISSLSMGYGVTGSAGGCIPF